MIRRAIAVLRAQGMRGVWFGGLAWAGIYRRLALVELSLDPPPPLLETPLQLDYGYLTETDEEEARARLAQGERCFVAWEAGVVVSSRWIVEHRAYVAYLDTWLDLEQDEVYLSEAFTSPSRRGHTVSGAAATRLAASLAAEGRRRILAGVLPENAAGRRTYEKVGYVGVGRIGYVKLGPWRRDFLTRGAPAP